MNIVFLDRDSHDSKISAISETWVEADNRVTQGHFGVFIDAAGGFFTSDATQPLGTEGYVYDPVGSDGIPANGDELLATWGYYYTLIFNFLKIACFIVQKLISKIRKIYNKKLMKKVALIGSIHKDGWKILENNNFDRANDYFLSYLKTINPKSKSDYSRLIFSLSENRNRLNVIKFFENYLQINENRLLSLSYIELLYSYNKQTKVIEYINKIGTYNERNLLGNGCWERNDEGLSNFGKDAIQEMNRLGILIDLSHVGDQTTIDSISLSDKPVACTHANARSFFNSPRNKTDDALKLIAEKGGVVGATAWPSFLRKGWNSTIEDYGDAIEDMIERIGINHVAIGTDYTQDQPSEWFDTATSQQGTKPSDLRLQIPKNPSHPKGLETPDKMSNISIELENRGFEKQDIEKILGGNWLRLLKDVWK